MSEFWVSRKRWTCPYCDITINDDVPSRMQHEGGMRHKGNVERSLKETYRKGEQARRDEEKAKAEMRKIEKVSAATGLVCEGGQGSAGCAPNSGVAPMSSFLGRAALHCVRAGCATSADTQSCPKLAAAANALDNNGEGSSSSSLAAAAKEAAARREKEAAAGAAKKPAWRPADKLAAYSSAASLGFADADGETPETRAARELAEQRAKEGVAGEWEVVAPPPPPPIAPPPAAVMLGSEQQEREEARAYKIKEKRAAFDSYDDDEDEKPEIVVKKRIKLESKEQQAAREAQERKHRLPQWQALKLEPKKQEQPDAAVPKKEKLGEPEEQADKPDEPKAEPEQAGSAPPDEAAPPPAAPKEETPEAGGNSGGGMFKKRRAGAGAGAKKVRAV